VVPPQPGFLETLREATTQCGALLVFDEVITGFRLGPGGAQERFGIRPDLTTLGKVIGGGFPLAAYGGRREIMERIAPSGPVYQAGTLSGNPVAVTAGLKTLELLEAPGFYEVLDARAARLAEGLSEGAGAAGIPACVQRVGSMLTGFFTSGPVLDFAGAKQSDTERYAGFFREMLDRGVYLAPSQFEAAFVSAAHTDAEIEATLAAAAESFRAISQ
jgi:glutamate-1-semialdehyde 2,1-aminomutase